MIANLEKGASDDAPLNIFVPLLVVVKGWSPKVPSQKHPSIKQPSCKGQRGPLECYADAHHTVGVTVHARLDAQPLRFV